MLLRHLAYTLMLSLLFCASAATAQVTTTAPPQAPALSSETRKELEQKALALLNEVVAEAQTLKRVENRIRIQAIAASLFWSRDKERARALFKEATEGLSEIMSSIDSSDPAYYTLIQTPAQLRQEMLQIIAPRDARMALEFLRATRQPPPPQTSPSHYQMDNELQMELGLAAQIAAEDPKLALQIAEESLSKGFSSALPEAVRQLMEKDREGALRLATNIIKKLQPEDLLTNQEAANVAVNLMSTLANFAQPSLPQDPEDDNRNVTPDINAQVYQELMNTVLTAALNLPLNYGSRGSQQQQIAQTLMPFLEPLMPQVERFAPSRAPALKRKIADYKKTLDPSTRMWMDYQELINNGTAEALLEAASKAPIEMRSNLYQQAAWKVLHQGDGERARQIIEENVSNPYERKQMLTSMEQQILWQKINTGKLDEARQMISQLRTQEERVQLLIQLATNAAGKGDKRGALMFLEEASNLLSNRAENYAQLQAQLQLAHAYASLEPARSFEILDAQVSQLNEMLMAAEVLNGFEQQYFQDGELMTQGTTLGNMVSQHINELSPLASTDFDRTKSVASRFGRHETRIMARLSIAQGILSGDAGDETTSGGDPMHRRTPRGISFIFRGNKRVPVVRF